MKILKNVPLKNFSTFKLGGNARYFAVARSVDDLKEAIRWARRASVPYMILGGGSNILISDEGYDGLVIKNQIIGREVYEKNGMVFISAGAGENWDTFVSDMVKRGLYGVENLSGIPGSVGATPIQNVGAYGVEAKDVLSWVEALNTKTMETELFPNSKCDFNYRDSFFKTKEGKNFVVTNVGFKLAPQGTPNIKYRDLQEYFNRSNTKPDPQTVRNAVLNIRARKFPDLNRYGCGGSFFKNPVLSQKELRVIQEKHPNIPFYEQEDGTYKVPLAWILENAVPWKGVRRRSIGVHKDQPLVLVHYGGGSSRDLKQLSDDITQSISRDMNVLITPEVSFVGRF